MHLYYSYFAYLPTDLMHHCSLFLVFFKSITISLTVFHFISLYIVLFLPSGTPLTSRFKPIEYQHFSFRHSFRPSLFQFNNKHLLFNHRMTRSDLLLFRRRQDEYNINVCFNPTKFPLLYQHDDDFYDLNFNLFSPSSVDIHSFLNNFDPSETFRLSKILHDQFIVSTTDHAKINALRSYFTVSPTNPLSFHESYDPSHEIFQFNTLDPALLPIVIDSGCSHSLTPNINDFIGDIKPCESHSLIGLNSQAAIVGKGLVQWHVRDCFNALHTITTQVYYVPDGNIRLFSPQKYFQENNCRGSCYLTSDRCTLSLPTGCELSFPYSNNGNLPLMLVDADCKSSHFAGFAPVDCHSLSTSNSLSFLSVAHDLNTNLTGAQRELLLWHWRLGHCNFQHVQSAMG